MEGLKKFNNNRHINTTHPPQLLISWIQVCHQLAPGKDGHHPSTSKRALLSHTLSNSLWNGYPLCFKFLLYFLYSLVSRNSDTHLGSLTAVPFTTKGSHKINFICG